MVKLQRLRMEEVLEQFKKSLSNMNSENIFLVIIIQQLAHRA